MAVEGTVLEFASRSFGHVWVSAEVTLAGTLNASHDLGVEPDLIVVICTDNAGGGLNLSAVAKSGDETNAVTVTNGGTTTAKGRILCFFSSRVEDVTPAAGNVYELASRSDASVYISDEKAVVSGGGTQTFDHETGRDLLFAIPVCVDSGDGDFDLSVVETTKSRLTVTNDGAAGTAGVVMLAFFGFPSTDPVGNTVEGTVIDIASLSHGDIYLSDETADIDNSNEELSHDIVRVPKMGVPIIQETGMGGNDDFDLSITLATLIVTIACADTDAAKARALVFFGTE